MFFFCHLINIGLSSLFALWKCVLLQTGKCCTLCKHRTRLSRAHLISKCGDNHPWGEGKELSFFRHQN